MPRVKYIQVEVDKKESECISSLLHQHHLFSTSQDIIYYITGHCSLHHCITGHCLLHHLHLRTSLASQDIVYYTAGITGHLSMQSCIAGHCLLHCWHHRASFNAKLHCRTLFITLLASQDIVYYTTGITGHCLLHYWHHRTLFITLLAPQYIIQCKAASQDIVHYCITGQASARIFFFFFFGGRGLALFHVVHISEPLQPTAVYLMVGLFFFPCFRGVGQVAVTPHPK